ncbi:uncharacterized protein LOC130894975 [Diorhabda carinulata]|uniref:uncharacterized protein LOC130894975 n=1 Tax=Diorhabda carinulata TaxID=1163345 RepID=UPI0025A0A727|nr:uncharacterized protein LOC130894975 [Diorhabda carinulata]
MLKMQSIRIVRGNESLSSLQAVSRKFSIAPLQRDEIVKKQIPNFNIHTKISTASEGAKKRRLLNTLPEQRVLDYQHSTRSTAGKPFAKTIKVKKHVLNSGAINEKRKIVTTDPMSIIPKIKKSVGSTAKKIGLSFVRKLVTDPKMAVANGYENKIKKIAKSQKKKDKQKTKKVEPMKANQGISSNFQTSVPISKNVSSQRKLGIKRKLNQFILKDFYGNQRLLVEGQILGMAISQV